MFPSVERKKLWLFNSLNDSEIIRQNTYNHSHGHSNEVWHDIEFSIAYICNFCNPCSPPTQRKIVLVEHGTAGNKTISCEITSEQIWKIFFSLCYTFSNGERHDFSSIQQRNCIWVRITDCKIAVNCQHLCKNYFFFLHFGCCSFMNFVNVFRNLRRAPILPKDMIRCTYFENGHLILCTN